MQQMMETRYMLTKASIMRTLSSINQSTLSVKKEKRPLSMEKERTIRYGSKHHRLISVVLPSKTQQRISGV
jgi:hypothetical protein